MVEISALAKEIAETFGKKVKPQSEPEPDGVEGEVKDEQENKPEGGQPDNAPIAESGKGEENVEEKKGAGEEEVKEPSEGSVEFYKKQLEDAQARERELLSNIDNLSRGGEILGYKGDREIPGQPKVEEKPKEEDVGFALTQEDFEKAMDSADGFSNVLKKVYNAGIEASMRSVAKVVPRVVSTQLGLQKTVDTFLADNEDLSVVQSYVGQIVNEMAAKDPNKPLPELLNEAGVEARKRLHLPKMERQSEGAPEPKKTLKPAFGLPNSRGPKGAQNAEELSEQQKHIRDVFPGHFKKPK
uniref:Uncharacterized protein n=1 Tax=viral metagenome TaxID=1070528 RepID=A0A6M3IZB5_9ZZZZ